MKKEEREIRSVQIDPDNPAYIVWIGTMHKRNLTFYMLNGQYLVRAKSSLDGNRVKRSPRFKKTMQFAGKLGKASAIASEVYGQLPEGWKLHSLYRQLVGVGNQLLKTQECTDEEVAIALREHLYSLGYNPKIDYEVIQPSTEQYIERGGETIFQPAVTGSTIVTKPIIIPTKRRVAIRRRFSKQITSYRLPDSS
ncbi:MAG: hypothetical protein QM731_12800 [Chitinophagaceae bacterium]